MLAVSACGVLCLCMTNHKTNKRSVLFACWKRTGTESGAKKEMQQKERGTKIVEVVRLYEQEFSTLFIHYQILIKYCYIREKTKLIEHIRLCFLLLIYFSI
jgi:hypothetical protein